jgi:hypothetical protein
VELAISRTNRGGRPERTQLDSEQQSVPDKYKEYLMTEGVKTIMYPVRDLANAKTL